MARLGQRPRHLLEVVLDDDRLAGSQHLTRNAVARPEHAADDGLWQIVHRANSSRALAIDQADDAAVRIEQLDRAADHPAEQAVQVELGGDRGDDLAQGITSPQLAAALGIQPRIEDGHRRGVGHGGQVANLFVARVARLAVIREHDPEHVLADQQRYGAHAVETGWHEVSQLGATRRTADRLLPFGIDDDGQPGGLDRVDRAVLEVVQDHRRRRTAGRADKLGAQQPQLRAEVALGRYLSTEVDQGAEATVLIAQCGEAVGDQGGHGLAGLYGQAVDGLAGSPVRAFRCCCDTAPTRHPSQRTGPGCATERSARGLSRSKFEG